MKDARGAALYVGKARLVGGRPTLAIEGQARERVVEPAHRGGREGPTSEAGDERGRAQRRLRAVSLDTMLELEGEPTAADVRAAMDGHVLARTDLTGLRAR